LHTKVEVHKISCACLLLHWLIIKVIRSITKRTLSKEKLSTLLRYGVAALSVALGLIVRLPLQSLLGTSTPFLTFFPAVLISAIYGGFGAGLFATFLSGLIANYFLVPPAFSFSINNLSDVTNLILYFVVGGIISWLGGVRTQAHLERIRLLERDLSTRQQLGKVTQQFFEVIENTRDGCYMLDREWRFTYVNRKATEMARTSLNKLLGKRFWDVFPEAMEHKEYQEFHRAMIESVPAHFEKFSEPYNIWYETDVYPSTEGLLVFVRDVTERKLASAALQQSEQRLRLAVEGAQMGTWDVDLLTGKAIWSELHFTMLGYEPTSTGEATEAMWVSRIHPDDVERVAQEWQQSRLECRRYHAEYRVIRADNQQISWLSAVGNVTYSHSGEPVRSIGVLFKITERKRAEAEIQTLNQTLAHRVNELQALFDLLPIGVAITEDPECRMVRANPYLSRVLRVPVDANVSQSAPPHELPAYRILKEGQEIAVEDLPMQYAAIHNAEVRDEVIDIVHPDSSVIQLLSYATPLLDDHGRVRGAIGCFADVTERRQAEAALRFSEQQFRLFVTASSDIVYKMSADWSEMCYLEGKDFLASTENPSCTWLERYIPQEDQPQVLAAIQQAICTKSAFELEHQIIQLDGTVGWIFSRAVPLLNAQNAIIEWFGAGSNITNSKRAEAERARLLQQTQAARSGAERANRIKDEFLAVLSHELRSPLNPILGWSKLLQNSKLDEARTKQALATIERNARLQSQLIEDLLDVSRILSGKVSLSVKPIDLASIIQAALETVQLAAQAKSIEIQTKLDPQVGLVCGDSTRLQQVVWNLLSNAVKFTPAQGRVEVHLKQIDYDAQITVIDTGIGIKPDFLPHVFEYFCQEDGTTTRKFGGLGLGLAIVRHLVELHGGTVKADSPGVDLGATFTVRLPLMPLQPTIAQDFKSSEPSVDLKGFQVLVVDDDTDTRDFVAFVLEKAGATVIAVSSASVAITALTQSHYDILLSDIAMPDMDGYMLMRHIKALPPQQGAHIKAIALTAYAGDFNQQKALQAGFVHHITKPIAPEQLVKAIAQVGVDIVSLK